jgi:cell division protein YceG involved in septum cleavage
MFKNKAKHILIIFILYFILVLIAGCATKLKNSVIVYKPIEKKEIIKIRKGDQRKNINDGWMDPRTYKSSYEDEKKIEPMVPQRDNMGNPIQVY